jgi:hypothetical protein
MVRGTCEFVEGRLLEIRVATGQHGVAEVNDMIQENVAHLPRDAKILIAADWSAVELMPPEGAARVRKMFEAVNTRVIRSAILTLPENPLKNLQVIRLIREAENPNRRHFTSAPALHTWLSELLTTEESQRLAQFLEMAPTP